MLCSTKLPRFGDKENSDFFEEYLQRLLEEREGFFTRENVALLTYAAGQEEGVKGKI